MEIGQETIGDAEAIARGDEEARLTGKLREIAVIASHAFQKPQGSRADGDDLSSPRLHLVQSFRCLGRDHAALEMHHWLSVSAARTGRNVPGPTCKVTKWLE